MRALMIIGFVIALLAINVFVGGWAVQYVVNFWGTYLKGVPVYVPFFPCAIAGLFLGEVVIPAAIATWIISFVL